MGMERDGYGCPLGKNGCEGRLGNKRVSYERGTCLGCYRIIHIGAGSAMGNGLDGYSVFYRPIGMHVNRRIISIFSVFCWLDRSPNGNLWC